MKEKEVEYLLRSMNEEKANRIQRYKRRDQYRSIIGEMIIKKYGVNPNCVSDVTFEFNKYGKPYLRGIEFNISHSSNWVVCAISTNKIGIDIEKVIDLDINIVDQYFHPIELNWMKKGTDKERLLKFYQLWTKKESFIKAIGKGMYMDLHSFVVKKINEQFCVYQHGKKVQAQLLDIPYMDGYDCSCCVLTSKPIEMTITSVDTDDLIEDMIRRVNC